MTTPTTPTPDAADRAYLARAIEAAWSARARGNHPFGAILVTADGVVVTAENTVLTDADPTGHAETNLVRRAAESFAPARLATSTLYTSTEPCAMCAGAIFWAGVPRVVFALGEAALIGLLPVGSTEFTLALPCREVFARGGHVVEVVGPVDLPGAVEVHAGFWQ